MLSPIEKRHPTTTTTTTTMTTMTAAARGTDDKDEEDTEDTEETAFFEDASPNLRPAGAARRRDGDAEGRDESGGDGSGGVEDLPMSASSFRFGDDTMDAEDSSSTSFESAANASMAVNTTFHSVYRSAAMDDFSDDDFSASSKPRRGFTLGALVKPALAFVAGFIVVSLGAREVERRRREEETSSAKLA